ncbi:heme biosynthesis protein HemY [Kiloniella laminariae]|uniref:Heme biosynthesis protein HemY n=1 Tax=Kiloniella laminariae TaxID=454162 RepID=A0ABT4LIZ6_9PROT|nr:heme biosynthesis HemY N-terminal domain-containing protein [Kiloniella laminariae]MCZ4281078.1 heme biosynthesis protein HemY [Kiloniella laminariae]
MKRTLYYFLKLALLLAVVIWIANRPGTVEIDWIGYRLETSVGILFLGVVFIAMLAAYLYRLWRGLIKAPALFGQARQDNRKKRGYKALTQGMVAVAAGDAQTATLMARKAEALLADEPPLTMLLSAQSAQLQGDEEAATNYFTAMLESGETRFLGLRGLLIQAQRRGDLPLALELAKQAHAISPKTPWVLESLFELSEASGDFAIADQALKDGAKTKNLSSAEATRKRAVIKLEQALISRDDGRHDEALVLAREAYKLAPDLVPAVSLLAEMNARAGKVRAAAKTLNKAWKNQPHRELARAYMSLWPSETPVERVKRLGQMVASNPDHYESHIALAEANLRAKLWGEARRHLKLAEEDKGASRLVCRLMGQLEQEEHGNSKAAAAWFEKAETALVAHNWICDSCGAIADQWQAHCGDCGRFDSLTWKRPTLVKSPDVPSQPAGQKAALDRVVGNEIQEVKKLPAVLDHESGKKTLKAPTAEIEGAARDLGA